MVFMSNAVKLAGVKTANQLTKEDTQPTVDSQVHNVRKELVQTQKILSVGMLTSELFLSKLETSWAFVLSATALQFYFSI